MKARHRPLVAVQLSLGNTHVDCMRGRGEGEEKKDREPVGAKIDDSQNDEGGAG